MLAAYSIEPGRVETQALIKHLQLEEQIVTLEELIALGQDSSTSKLLVLLVSNLNAYVEVIKSSSRKIVIIHLSDETYDVKAARLYLHPKIQLIIRNYEVFSLSFIFGSCIKWLPILFHWIVFYWREGATFRENLQHSKHMFLSRRYLLRQVRFALLLKKVKAKIVQFPLNETNFYFDGVKDNPQGLLYLVSFAGGAHSSERVVAVKTARELGYAHSYSGEWKIGGTALTSEAYVNLLRSSQFTLCPNGHVNQDCFRFYEAISAGSLPLVPSATPYQPFSYYEHLYALDPRLKVKDFRASSVKMAINSIDKSEIPLILKKLQSSIAMKNQIAMQALQDAVA